MNAGSRRWLFTDQNMIKRQMPSVGYMKLLTTLWSGETHKNVFQIMASTKRIRRYFILIERNVCQIVFQPPSSTATKYSTNQAQFLKGNFQTSTIFYQV